MSVAGCEAGKKEELTSSLLLLLPKTEAWAFFVTKLACLWVRGM